MRTINYLISHIQNKFLSRHRHVIKKADFNRIHVDGRTLTDFSSNDYLHIATHPDVKKAFTQGAMRYGLGSGASAMIAGYTVSHHLLEEEFAAFLNRERALLFNSGYHANLGVITTFANRNTTIIADKYCHASLIDGILLSRCKYERYQHNNLAHAENLIKANRQSLLITESIFSMQGNITDVKKLAAIAMNHDAFFIVDDAHGFGILGEQGKGICEHDNLPAHSIPCLITPLGKAAGGFGAIVSGSNDTIEMLLQSARTYRYSTSLPPAICEAVREAIKIIKHESWRREKLRNLIAFFIKSAKERQLTLASYDETPIKPIIIGSNKDCLSIQNELMQQGFFVPCIRPPTVPTNTARLRISLNCLHKENQITDLLDRIKISYDRLQKNDR